MKNPSSNSNAESRRGTAIRLSAIAGCLLAALGLALWFRPSPKAVTGIHDSAPPPTPVAAPATPEETLASIAVPAGDSSAAKLVKEATTKLHKKPSDPAAWVNLGSAVSQLLRDSGDQSFYDTAEKCYQQALRLKPDSADAMNGMAWVTGGRHIFDASKDWAGKALAIAPGSADAYGIIGDADLELGDYKQAYDHYQKMMDLRPDLSSWSRGAYLLWITGNKVKAVALMEQALRAGAPFAENTAWCRAKLATMLMHDGAFPAAAQTLEPSLREHSRNPHVLLAAARLAISTDDFEAAEQYYRLLNERIPNIDALAGLGDLRAFQNHPEEAEKYYRQVEELHAAHLTTGVHDHMQMAKFLADHDRNLVEALRLAEQNKLSRNVLAADCLAWVYFKNGDQTKAIEAIKLALSQRTPDSEIHYHAALIADKFGDQRSAKSHLEQALALNPKFDLIAAPAALKMLERLSAGKAVAAVNPESSNKAEVK